MVLGQMLDLEMMHDKEAEVELFRSGQQKTEAEVVALKEQAAASEAEVAALKVKMEEEGAASAVEVADLKAKLQEHWLECVATENKRKEAEDQCNQVQQTLEAEYTNRASGLEKEVEAKVPLSCLSRTVRPSESESTPRVSLRVFRFRRRI